MKPPTSKAANFNGAGAGSGAGFGESDFRETNISTRPKSATVRSETNLHGSMQGGRGISYATVRPELDVYAAKKLPPRQYSRIKVPAKGYALGKHF